MGYRYHCFYRDQNFINHFFRTDGNSRFITVWYLFFFSNRIESIDYSVKDYPANILKNDIYFTNWFVDFLFMVYWMICLWTWFDKRNFPFLLLNSINCSLTTLLKQELNGFPIKILKRIDRQIIMAHLSRRGSFNLKILLMQKNSEQKRKKIQERCNFSSHLVDSNHVA